MEFPTLKFSEPHGKLEAPMKYELGRLDPDGFAAMFFESLKTAEKEVNTGYSYTSERIERADRLTGEEDYKLQYNRVALAMLANMFLSVETPVSSVLMSMSVWMGNQGIDSNPYPTVRMVCLIVSAFAARHFADEVLFVLRGKKQLPRPSGSTRSTRRASTSRSGRLRRVPRKRRSLPTSRALSSPRNGTPPGTSGPVKPASLRRIQNKAQNAG